MRVLLGYGLGLWLALGACSGGYPLEPTRCDEWCDITKGGCEEYYDPAGCVIGCEASGISHQACDRPLANAIGCYRRNPAVTQNACRGSFVESTACQKESLELATCREGLAISPPVP